jgi:hypothetical protein
MRKPPNGNETDNKRENQKRKRNGKETRNKTKTMKLTSVYPDKQPQSLILLADGGDVEESGQLIMLLTLSPPGQ